MINVTIRYDTKESKIYFPCSGHILDAKLKELGVGDMNEAKMFVTEVNDFKFLLFLEDDFVDIDKLNLLASRLCYLEPKELEKLECVAEEFNIRNFRELINLTANLHRFTLIQDMSSAEQIGRTHYFTRLISIEDNTKIPTDFARIGKELVNSGTGRFTEHGMLFVSDDIPAINRYNGIPAPENLQGDKIVEVSVAKDMKTVSLWLPESENTINRVLCFDTAIDADKFCNTKSAVFIIMPEEDNTKYFMVSLIVQQLYREMLAVADETDGKLNNRVVFYLDEIGTIPKIESLEMMFSAGRSRKISIIAIIQSFAQLEKNYGKEGSSIIIDNCQLTVFGGFEESVCSNR